jgi:hypothetical protein
MVNNIALVVLTVVALYASWQWWKARRQEERVRGLLENDIAHCPVCAGRHVKVKWIREGVLELRCSDEHGWHVHARLEDLPL